MRKLLFCLSFVVPFVAGGQANLAENIGGKWKSVDVKTSDDALNQLLQLENRKIDLAVDFSKVAPATKGKATVRFSNERHEAVYVVDGNKITVTTDKKNPLEINKAVMTGEMKTKDALKITLPPELTESLISPALKMYLNQGGEPFVAKMAEAMLVNSGISVIVRLKRE